MLQINVALPNGHAELLSLLPSSTVQDVRTKAERAFGKKYLRLITAKSRVLANPEETLKDAEIEDGECLAALVLQPQLAATRRAFALWCHGDSAIVTWGGPRHGSDSSAVRDQLKGVRQIQATRMGAFAAILTDGSVVTWGDSNYGGDSSAFLDELKGVRQIQATEKAFAAILEDGSVVTWGYSGGGGDSSAVQDQLVGVQQIQATTQAFAAILADGSVVTWGYVGSGGDSSAVRDQSGVCGRFKPLLKGPLLRFWKMDLSLPGAMRSVGVTVQQFDICSRVCNRFKPHGLPLLRFWQMDLS